MRRTIALSVATLLMLSGLMVPAIAGNHEDNDQGGGSKDNTCDDRGYPEDHKVETDEDGTSIDEEWGSLDWSDEKSLDYDIEDGWSVEVCVKTGGGLHEFTFTGEGSEDFSHGVSHVSWRNATKDEEEPKDVKIGLEKKWFDAEGEPAEAPESDVVTLTAGEKSTNEGGSVKVEKGTSYDVTESLPDGWSEVDCDEVTDASAYAATGTGTDFSADEDGKHLVCNQEDADEGPADVEIGLEKQWFDAEGESAEAPESDVVTLTAGEESTNEGGSVTVEEGASYDVTEDLPNGWEEVDCDEVTETSGYAETGTGTEFSADADGTHLVCNQAEDETGVGGEVIIALEKLWFDEHGDLIEDAPKSDAVTLTSEVEGKGSIHEGDDISLEVGSKYSVSEDLDDDWSEVDCADVTDVDGVAFGTDDEFEVGESGTHYVCNQADEDDDEDDDKDNDKDKDDDETDVKDDDKDKDDKKDDEDEDDTGVEGGSVTAPKRVDTGAGGTADRGPSATALLALLGAGAMTLTGLLGRRFLTVR